MDCFASLAKRPGFVRERGATAGSNCGFLRAGHDASLGAAGASCVREDVMTESVYKIIELIGTSKESWEKAATSAVERAAKTLRDLRVAEVAELDLQLDAKGKVEAYRAKLKVSFKFEGS
jgi:dodecin